jgi:hypothetical protein
MITKNSEGETEALSIEAKISWTHLFVIHFALSTAVSCDASGVEISDAT